MVNNLQPSLTISKFVAVEGIFPSQSGGSGGQMTLGMIRQFGGNFDPGADRLAQGQLLSIASNDVLFNLIGTTYGGDGQSTFALPNETGRPSISQGQGPGLSPHAVGDVFGVSAVAIAQANLTASSGGTAGGIQNTQPTAVTQYLIRLSGSYAGGPDTTPLAEIVEFAGNFVPSGYAACNGQLLSINQNQALFSLLGTNFGGNGQTTFALPDLRGRVPVGTGTLSGQTLAIGQQAGASSVVLQQSQMPAGYGGSSAPIDNRQPSLGLTYLIAMQGVFPSRDAGSAPSGGHYVGEIILYAGEPGQMLNSGWAICDGRTLPISQNTALFSLLGTQYGGNGQSTFALPDFRGRTAVGQGVFEGVTQSVGMTSGVGTYTLAPTDIPVLNISGTVASETFYGGTFGDNITGADGSDVLYGADGNDTLNGGTGPDILYGNTGNDTLYGNQDNDVLYGGQGNDVAYGGQGDDVVYGNLGDDTLFGNLGADTLFGGAGINIMDGGDGVDTASYADAATGVTVSLLQGLMQNTGISTDNLTGFENLTGSAYNDVLTGDPNANVLTGGAGADTLSGGLGADVLYGNQDDDILYGNQDNDVLYGGQGNDVIYGGQGDDLIVGGAGADVLYGNLGSDTFLYVTTGDFPTTGVDVIADFLSGTDKIDLRPIHTGGASDSFSLSTSGGVTTLNVDLGNNGSIDLRVTILGTAVTGDVIWT